MTELVVLAVGFFTFVPAIQVCAGVYCLCSVHSAFDIGKDAVVLGMELNRGVHLPFQAIDPIGGYTTESVLHGQCDARPTVTFCHKHWGPCEL